GFIVTVTGLVPPLVALYRLPPNVAWRISSLLGAFPILWFVLSLPARRRAATGMPVPSFIMVILVIQAAAGCALLVNAVFSSVAQAGAIYATAVSLVLVTSGAAYLLALGLIRPEIAAER